MLLSMEDDSEADLRKTIFEITNILCRGIVTLCDIIENIHST
jgi:hypothetical protein